MNKIIPARAEHLESLPSKPISWDPLVEAIRPECRGPYIDKAKLAAEVGLWDSAMLYFWNEAMNDLKRKVIAYGIEYFPTSTNRNLSDEDALREQFNDYELIEGCYQLGIITKEAWFFLQKCREIRNQYTAAHLSDSQIDALEAQNFIKNTVKYVLAHDLPSPGFSIKDFMERLRNDDVRNMVDEIQVAVQGQSPQIRDALLNRLFSEYIDPNCSTTLRGNIESIVPVVWNAVDQQAHADMGQRYVKVRVGPSQDAALLSFNFFKLVGGIGSIPDAYRRPIYESHAKDLLSAHFGANNFYQEDAPAKALLELDYDIPKESAPLYAKAVILSYIGNPYGYCWAAERFNQEMLSHFNIDCVRATIQLLDSDQDIQSALTSEAPAKRFKSIVDILLGGPILPAHERALAIYKKWPVNAINKHFMDKLFPVE